MADLLLTFAAEQILERVGTVVVQEIAGPWRLKKDLQTLSEFVEGIHAKVQEVRNNQAANGQVKPLLIKLQDVLYSAEDVLDEFSYETLRRRVIQRQPVLRLCGFVSRENPILFRLKMTRKVKKINQSLDDIEKRVLREIIITGKAVADPIAVSNDQLDRVTDSYFDKSGPPVIGRASEVETIINILRVRSSTPLPLTVISIVGFGGLGKTTLAKMVLHQVGEAKLFDETIWVCVSQPFDVKKILKGMLETLDKNAGGLDNVDAILRHLKKKLEDKRLFLVLDDVWEDNRIKCDSLKSHLLNICNTTGNFVIVTTRNSDVANAMDAQHEHVVQLKVLKDNECWDIIREKWVMQWGGSVPEELEQIGVAIAKKCNGVPLVAKVVGGTLCKKKNREEWLSIKNNDAWEQIDEDNQIFPVLKLSFHQLDLTLKQCFVYCSLFPKDFEYDRERLIQLWMAEGFFSSTTTNPGSSVKSMEDVGDDCFNALIVHSFFQDVQANKWGNIRSCKMHDFLHDFATSVSNYKMLNLKDGTRCFVRTPDRRHHPSAKELESGGAKNVRSIISTDFNDAPHMLSTFKSLRSLDISDAGLKELPSVIGRLKHLRYLDISYNRDIKELPEFIAKLYNLQTLQAYGGWPIRMPTNLVNLGRLRHIHIDYHDLKIYKVGYLIELRTLPRFVARQEDGFRIEELKGLNELKGKLRIAGLENVRDREEAEGANLKEKKLTKLILQWKMLVGDNDENVLEGLLPPPSIKRLKIYGYNGVKFPNWMSMGINDSQYQLSQLVELSLRYCMTCEIMPSLGHLPSLKILEVSDLDNIKCIGSEFYGECKGDVILFSALRKLSVQNMESLEEWGAIEGGDGTRVEVFPLLEYLQIQDCPRLRSIPLRHLSSLVRFSITWCRDMEYVSNDFQNFPSLDNLEIRDCRSLVSLSSLQDLRSLRILRIEWCDELTSLPNVDLPSSLQALSICRCPKVTSVPHWIKFCTSLQKLDLNSCERLISIDDDIISSLTQLKTLSLGPFSEELESFPGLNAINHPNPSIEELTLCGGGKLKSLPHQLQHLTALKTLRICDFKGVETLPDWLGNFSNLQILEIGPCQRLTSIDDSIFNALTELKDLTMGPFSEDLEEFLGLNSIHLLSLDELEIRGWPKLKSLPEQLQHLTALKKLSIRDFQGVETLPDWLGNLSSLQELDLSFCDNLNGLPTTLKRLSNLTTLSSDSCPLLRQRYNQEDGPDRHHISHISNTYF